MNESLLTPAGFDQAVKDAAAWQYLTVKAGGMARKSDLDRWLMKRFNIRAYDARGISNMVEQRYPFAFSTGSGGAYWKPYCIDGMPEPTSEQYPEL